MIWFTADTHFGHENIIRYSKRPFANAAAMDEALIENWNRCVRPGDDVWHLGDFAMSSARPVSYYLKRLNGRVHIIWGNHDDKMARVVKHLFASAQEMKYLRHAGEKITLYHYAQRVWRNSHHGAWHLFGHSHGMLPNFHRSMDVGVDAQNYRPVSFEEVKRYMDKQEVTLHHPELVTDPWDKC